MKFPSLFQKKDSLIPEFYDIEIVPLLSTYPSALSSKPSWDASINQTLLFIYVPIPTVMESVFFK